MPQVVVRLIPKEGAPKERCKPIADRLLKAFQGEHEPSGAVEVTVIVEPGHPDADPAKFGLIVHPAPAM